MHPATTLMLCSNPSLIKEVEGIVDVFDSARLEVCGRIDKAQAHAEQRDDVALLLLHLDMSGNHEQVEELVRNSAGSGTKLVVLVNREAELSEQCRTLLRQQQAQVISLPADRCKLAALVQGIGGRGRRPASTSCQSMTNSPDSDMLVRFSQLEERMEQLERIAPQDTTVLLTGETGTGKTWLARCIHDLSPRRNEPFLIVDFASISPNLIESEIFGHVKGAFSGADGHRAGKLAAVGRGTLVLDEINSLPLPMQSKLLRAVEERVFEPVGSNAATPLHARIIAVSNTRLEDEVACGNFRADLFYRLNVVCFHLLPLRSCRGSIPTLATHFLRHLAPKHNPEICGIGSDAMELLSGYDWPGNIRELRNVIERAVALCMGPQLEARDLPAHLRTCPDHLVDRPGLAPVPNSLPNSLPNPLRYSGGKAADSECQAAMVREMELILWALEKHQNNRQRAAAELGISRMSFYNKLHKYGLIDEKLKRRGRSQICRDPQAEQLNGDCAV
jgi:DNA-binding NtrC family response regulator